MQKVNRWQLFFHIIILIFLLSFAAQSANLASDEDESPLLDSVIAKHLRFETHDRKSEIHLVVRNDGHPMGFYKTIELRANCGKKHKNWKGIPADEDFERACDVDLDSIHFEEKTGIIRLAIREPDSDRYNTESRKNPVTAKVYCSKKVKKITLKVGKLCS